MPSAVLPMCCVLRYLSAIMRSVAAVGCQILRNQRKSIEIRTKYRRWQEILRNSIQSRKHDDDGTQHKTKETNGQPKEIRRICKESLEIAENQMIFLTKICF